MLPVRACEFFLLLLYHSKWMCAITLCVLKTWSFTRVYVLSALEHLKFRVIISWNPMFSVLNAREQIG
jgi:hypothetical protein